MNKYVKARVGEVVDQGGRSFVKSMEIGQIISPVGKSSWRVCFHGIGLTTNVSSSSLTLVPAAEISRLFTASTATATNGGGEISNISSSTSMVTPPRRPGE